LKILGTNVLTMSEQTIHPSVNNVLLASLRAGATWIWGWRGKRTRLQAMPSMWLGCP